MGKFIPVIACAIAAVVLFRTGLSYEGVDVWRARVSFVGSGAMFPTALFYLRSAIDGEPWQ